MTHAISILIVLALVILCYYIGRRLVGTPLDNRDWAHHFWYTLFGAMVFFASFILVVVGKEICIEFMKLLS